MTRDFEGEVKREDLVEMAHGNQMFSLEEKKIAFLKIATKQATNAPCTSKKKASRFKSNTLKYWCIKKQKQKM